ncbi:MAG: M20/M25/M40 family metallo-hydrolase, partial [Planctomycetes bacterium]|nr:M20/M25/M40 family metallo-hydrolase [Planctomycetota bacterium]
QDRLVSTFLELVQIDSPSGHEEEIARHLTAELKSLGLTVERDTTGNVIGLLAGEGPPILLSAHMDTVEPGRGVKPVITNGIITSDGATILGGDDKSGVAAILEVLQVLVERELSHPPLEVALTTSEETGLNGAKGLDLSTLRAKEGIVLDSGGEIGTIVVSAPSQDKLRAVVHGKAAHAGAEPEKGINAIVVAAEAIAAMPLGRIDEETTANIGRIQGGTATNIVPDRTEMAGEARSHDERKLEAQVQAMTEALKETAERHGATVEIDVQRSYSAFKLSEEDDIVRRAVAAATTLGLTPALVPSGGGSDANIFNAGGITTINISSGMDKVHTTEERLAVDDLVKCAEFLLA